MATLTLLEQSRLARIAAERTGRSVFARILRSRALKWHYDSPIAEELLMVPSDMRTADPSFAAELAAGQLGLGGAVASIGKGSIFDVPAPSDVWARSLHGFGWLRNLSAAGRTDDRALALDAVLTWIDRFPTQGVEAWQPDVIGRRIFSWLANSAFLLTHVDEQTYDKIASSLSLQLAQLSTRWQDAPSGYPRIEALVGLLTGSLCLKGHEARIAPFQQALASQLRMQVLADGGHISRNPNTVVDLLLDLLPIRTCFRSRNIAMEQEIEETIGRMLRFTRYMRLGDGSLARFNGMGATPFDSLATVLAYDRTPDDNLINATSSRYARVSAGPMILIVDVGKPPPLEYAGAACAGALSFELSLGGQAVFINAGAPGPADQDWVATSRATASHNTLCLNSTSTAKLLNHSLLRRLVRGAPIRHPENVACQLDRLTGASVLRCQHDGYKQRYQIYHRREFTVEESGQKITCEELIRPMSDETRFPRDLPYAIHFHLADDVVCQHDDDPTIAQIKLRNGETWYFRARGTTLAIEESVYFADLAGPANSLQIVLRGSSFGDSRIVWTVQSRHPRFR